MMWVKKMKNEKRKSTRMPISEEGKTSKVTLGQFDTLAFPHIYLIIHTTRAILSLVPFPSDFICTFVTPRFSPYPDKEPFTQISSFSFYIQTGTIYMNCFPFRINLLYYFLLNKLFILPSLKST